MKTFSVEITDTCGGDANYSWVRRYTITARSMRGAVMKMAREYSPGWKFNYGNPWSARYDLQGAAICMFINETESVEETNA